MPKQRPKKPATIVDVARQAGVSLGTASRVMNNRRDVAPDLRRRVMEAARILHYVRTRRGRRAARESLPVISFVLANREFLHPMHARMLQGAEQYCEERGYFVVFKRFDYAPETRAEEMKLPSLLREHGIADSMILAGTNYPNLVEATAAAGIPYVLYGNNLVGYARLPRTDLARSDDRAGCLQAVRYLVKLGHRQICYVGDISQPWFANRYQAYLSVVEEAGLEPMAQTVRLSADNFQSGFHSAEVILRQGLRPTAIFCGSDHIALGVWEQLRRGGVRVPQDCSLVGFDDIPDAEVTNPPLTTVRNPFLEVGRELARLAIEKAKSPCAPVAEAVLPTELVMRGTTWPCLENLPSG
ncbi:MAG TPA: LacI family DNA-binding transcriptional regulator [Candidatus Acidoferrales bacterium]|nr:LacI family DNA-binding transcriptional regulator [Candidatus Acidoferrales bacterium]